MTAYTQTASERLFPATSNHMYTNDSEPVQGNIPRRIIRSEVAQFAGKANSLADQILSQNSANTYKGPVVIRNHYYYSSPFYSPWYYPSPSVIILPSDGGRRRRENENNNGASVLLGVVATVGALAATYAIGSAVACHQDAQSELEDTRRFQEKIFHYQGQANQTDQPLLVEATQAASLKERICTRIRNSAALDLAFRITLAVGLTFTAIGAFSAASPLIGFGLTLSVISAGAMLFKWGFESIDKANMRDAQFLKSSIINLKQL